MFERELDYYGITSNEGMITDQGSLMKTMTSVKAQYHEAKMNHDMFFLAQECYHQYGKAKMEQARMRKASVMTVMIDEKHDLYNRTYVGGRERELFDEYLGMHGLEVYSCKNSKKPNRCGRPFSVQAKK